MMELCTWANMRQCTSDTEQNKNKQPTWDDIWLTWKVNGREWLDCLLVSQVSHQDLVAVGSGSTRNKKATDRPPSQNNNPCYYLLPVSGARMQGTSGHLSVASS